MGGKGGPVSTNDQLVQMQEQQAAQAAEANKQTQSRLTYGVNEIDQMFQGVPSGSSLLDLSSLANANYSGAMPGSDQPYSPGTTTTRQVPVYAATGRSTAQPRVSGGLISTPTGQTRSVTTTTGGTPGGALGSGYSWAPLADTGGAQSYGIFDPSGNLVTDANSLAQLAQSKIYVGGDPNNLTGGYPQSFYDNYRNSIMNYYLPQEDQQYQNARSSLNYGLARAGQLNSGIAGQDIANLANQDQVAQAQIGSQADQQEAALRTQIQQDQQTALNQLYSTENPTVAANTAGNMVANANLTKPVLDPVGQLFSNISVGVGNAISGFTNPYAYINPSAGGMGQLTTQASGSTAGGSSGSGSTGVG